MLPAERETAEGVIGELLDAMERIRRAHDFSGKGLGLAAPQIGNGWSRPAPTRSRCSTPASPPRPASEEMDEKYEGCLSFIDVRALVPRALRITVESVTPGGNASTAVYEHGVARLISHEINRLDGLLLLNRMRARR
ncbi:peptide deformylase [Streptomyces sp. 5.8]|uniref:peptide deformylase n=1 Tax=Streptomyces sp. 5.8 TaxID=3406571 RepID=UPI003BB6EF92